jgi:hypothetical protein
MPNMASLGRKDAFAKYGATLRNVQWSVSAWAPDGSLVLSLWAHHYRKGPGGSAEYFGSASRWSGPGNQEFKENVARAFREKACVRLVISSTEETGHIESGEDASKVKKDLHVREDLFGQVIEFDGNNYVIRFTLTRGGGK